MHIARNDDVVRSSLTFHQVLPCHREHAIGMVVPFVAYDDGAATFEQHGAHVICPVCQRDYVMANVGNRAITRRRDKELTLDECFEAIRVTLRNDPN